MEKTQLDPVATILADAYLATWAYSRSFRDEYERPPTKAARVQHMRSVAQAGFDDSEQYELKDYLEFGRVQFTDLQADSTYLLRSQSAVSIESSKQQAALFDSTQYLKTDVVMLVYKFHKAGIDLLISGTRHRSNSKHLEATGEPSYVGTWPYEVTSGDIPPFDQGYEDPFGDLGDLDIEDEGKSPE